MLRHIADRALFLPIAIGLAFIAIRYDFTYIGLGILFGVALVIYEYVKEGETYSLKFGIIFLAIGIIGFILSLYFSSKYGLSFQELTDSREFPRYIRRMPYYSVSLLMTGMVVVIYRLLGQK